MSTDAERWDRRWAAATGPIPAPHPLVQRLARGLPRGARVLDVAAGRGRHAVALAAAGLEVVAVDVSAVGLARIAAAAAGVETRVVDLTAGLPADLAGGFDAVVCVDYRDPAGWPGLRDALAPGGHLLVSMATVRNLERHGKPSARFLATPSDPLALIADLDWVHVSWDWRASGRHEQWVWARAAG